MMLNSSILDIKQQLNCYLRLSTVIILYSLTTTTAQAQIESDATLSTQVNTTDNQHFIIHGGTQAGSNLFHSFEQFSVPTNGEAFFNNTSHIANIISRVTGGELSHIDGLIRANGSANLLLINPAGIIFGNNARLNIGGSFLGSTANSILFPNGIEFSASDTQTPPLLTINMPIGLGLLNNPAPIVHRSRANNIGLEVASGNNFTLVGGEINLTGGIITVPGGRVELGSLSTAGDIGINADGSLSFPEGIARADVNLTNQAAVNVRAGDGGFININARNLTLSEQSELFAGIAENIGSPNAQAGDITINATESVRLIGNPRQPDLNADRETIERDTAVGIRNNVGLSSARRNDGSSRSNSLGNGGSIIINTGTLELSNISVLDTSLFGEGSGGNITINADNVSVNQGVFLSQVRGNDRRFATLQENANGNAGDVSITANTIAFNDFGLILTNTVDNAMGNAGNIFIQAAESFTLSGDSFLLTQLGLEAIGNAGNINITADSLEFNDRTFVPHLQADAQPRSVGNAGDITINVATTASFDGTLILSQIQRDGMGQGGDITIKANDDINFTGGSLILTGSRGRGNSGNITIEAGDSISLEGLFQENRGRFRLFPSQIVAQLRTEAEGNAGNISIKANELSLQDVASISSNTSEGGVGSAGNITINVKNLSLAENAFINASTSNNFDGGEININAQTLNLESGGKLVTTTDSSGNAGNINLNISERITFDNSTSSSVSSTIFPEERDILNQLQSEPSGIFADASLDSTGNGGSVNIGIDLAPKQFTIANNAKISLDNKGEGNGGNLLITSESFTLDNNVSISASTFSGEGGNINLKINDALNLQNNSLISAQALGNANGGNINIDTGFIIASPNQNNDIIANAQQGTGGNININAEAIFGFVEATNSEPFNITNDIDASSMFGLDGTVEIRIPQSDVTESLSNLPTDVINVEQVLQASFCRNSNYSQYYVTGRGGIPLVPSDRLLSEHTWTDWRIISSDNPQKPSPSISAPPQPINPEIVIAQGWIMNEQGKVVLTAAPLVVTPHPPEWTAPDCSPLSQ